jgi:hypothetical protein
VLLDRNVEVASGLERAINRVALNRRGDSVEVGEAELLEPLHLLGKARHPVADPVREKRRAEAAVAATRGVGDPRAVEQDHVASRIALLCQHGRP